MEECLFCKIIRGEIPSSKVYEDDKLFAFRDINSQAPVHVLLIPKTHISSASELTDPELAGALFMGAAKIAHQEGLKEKGYRMVCNNGKDAGQTVHHLHVHILGGRHLSWPPG